MTVVRTWNVQIELKQFWSTFGVAIHQCLALNILNDAEVQSRH